MTQRRPLGALPRSAGNRIRRVPPGRLAMPGPVDPARFLALELEDGALADANGAVLPLKP